MDGGTICPIDGKEGGELMAWQTPKTNWQAADVVRKDDFNRIEGNIQHLQDTKETPAGAQAKAEAAAGAVQAELDAHLADTAPHSATSSATANRIMIRDASGRAKVAAPSASDDIARKDTVDAHANRVDNPHAVTKSQVGLSNVDNMSALAIRTDISKALRVEVKSSAPSSPTNGQIWYDSTNHKFKGYANGAWV